MAKIAPIVTTPVPPTPVITMLNVLSIRGSLGLINSGNSKYLVSNFLIFAPVTVTKLGQKPLMQEKSRLQADWLICLFLPNSVSIGRIDTQLDFVPQSPHPSQTS